jgi:hypothetical protein
VPRARPWPGLSPLFYIPFNNGLGRGPDMSHIESFSVSGSPMSFIDSGPRHSLDRDLLFSRGSLSLPDPLFSTSDHGARLTVPFYSCLDPDCLPESVTVGATGGVGPFTLSGLAPPTFQPTGPLLHMVLTASGSGTLFPRLCLGRGLLFPTLHLGFCHLVSLRLVGFWAPLWLPARGPCLLLAGWDLRGSLQDYILELQYVYSHGIYQIDCSAYGFPVSY